MPIVAVWIDRAKKVFAVLDEDRFV